MSIRVRYKLVPSVSSDSTEARDLGNATYEVISDLMSEGGSWKAVVPYGASAQQLPLSSINNLQFLIIRTAPRDPTLPPVTVTIRKNSPSGEAIDIVPFGAKEGLLALTTTGITSLWASNASTTTDMELSIFAAGI